MTAEPLDPAAVMVEHRANEIEGMGPDHFCLECDVEWPCEPYRLADALAAAQRDLAAERAKVRRVEAVRDDLRATDGDADFYADPVGCILDALDAALASEGAADQPQAEDCWPGFDR